MTIAKTELLDEIQNTRDTQTELLHGRPLPKGWTGKLWALQQGVEEISQRERSPTFLLLSDADIIHPQRECPTIGSPCGRECIGTGVFNGAFELPLKMGSDTDTRFRFLFSKIVSIPMDQQSFQQNGRCSWWMHTPPNCHVDSSRRAGKNQRSGNR